MEYYQRRFIYTIQGGTYSIWRDKLNNVLYSDKKTLLYFAKCLICFDVPVVGLDRKSEVLEYLESNPCCIKEG